VRSPRVSWPISNAGSKRWVRPARCKLGRRRVASLIVATAVFAARPALAAYDASPRNLIPSSTTLAHVRAEFRRAHLGGHTKNATLIEDWRLSQDGQTGSFRVRRLGRDYRETTTLGPLVYENGVHGGVRWQQNRNGITFTYSGFHERDAISAKVWNSNNDRDARLIGESVPLNAFVVEIDPPNGRHQWLFIDKHSGQVVRVDRLERNRRFVTTYEDFKPFDGESLPNHIRTVDSLGNEREQTLVSRSLDTTPNPSDVAIVPTRRTLVEFPPGFSAVHLPVRFVNGLLVVRVSLNGRPFDFLLDSGAAGIVIDPIVAESLGLERYGERVGATIGPFPETTAIVSALNVGLLRMHNVVAHVVSIPFRADDQTRVSGLLGFDFFAEIVVHIDAGHGIVEAMHPAAFRAPAELTAVALGLDDKQPAVRIKVGPVAARVILDTGANRTVLESSFAERLDPRDETASQPSARFRGVGGTGIAETARIKDIEFAGVAIPQTLVDVSAADLGFEDIDGLIGTDFMREYDLFFDYRNNTVYARHLND
jgi:predicted aspartyl protease